MSNNQLKKWFREFNQKRLKIINKIKKEKFSEVLEYFLYSNMKEKEPEFCPLYKTGELCHNMDENELVCFYCGCPFFDFELWDEEKQLFGGCKIGSIKGFRNEYGYWDCSECTFPHTHIKEYINDTKRN